MTNPLYCWKPFSVNMSESGRYQFDACNIRLIPGTLLQVYGIDSHGTLNHIGKVIVFYIASRIYQENGTQFVVLCFIVFWYQSILSYSLGLLHWYWDNLMIGPVPVEQPWRLWAYRSCESCEKKMNKKDYMNHLKTHDVTSTKTMYKKCAYLVGNNVCPLRGKDSIFVGKKIFLLSYCFNSSSP